MRALTIMTRQIRHRGPDDSNHWSNPARGIYLGHCRLSILDLSSFGKQPMHSPSGRWSIVLNGEIYNFKELRRELEELNIHFRGNSDTEVLLAAFEAWGLQNTLEKIEGMFAFAVWDQESRSLFLARDRLGEKPLYYGSANKQFLFASEIKAITAHPEFENAQDFEAAQRYFELGYVPSPYSIYKNIRKLPPGTFLKIDHRGKLSEPVSYWDLPSIVRERKVYQGSKVEAVTKLDELLRKVIKKEMLSDVPLGAFLSGGIDSSAIVALMQAESPRPIKTFTIGFDEVDYNEAAYAKQISNHLGTDHAELYVSPEDGLKLIPALGEIYDEPFADSSAIPTFLISKLARSKVTVSLSGDGGDEVFGGYNRYFVTDRIWGKLGYLPHDLRRSAAWVLKHTPPSIAYFAARFAERSGLTKISAFQLLDRIPKIISLINSKTSAEVYGQFATLWKRGDGLLSSDQYPEPYMLEFWNQFSTVSDIEKMMCVDLLTYLPGDILTKVDRASMANSLEIRAPFLHHHILEFSLSLPMRFKISKGQGKIIVRELLKRYIPTTMMDRPKMGFGIPLAAWLRGPLKDWAEGFLFNRNLVDEEFLNMKTIRKAWSGLLRGSTHKQFELWTVIQYLDWVERTQNQNLKSHLRSAL